MTVSNPTIPGDRASSPRGPPGGGGLAGRLVRLDLTLESVTGCREKPTTRFFLAVAEAGPGDRLEVVADEEVLPRRLAVEALEAEGFTVEEVEEAGHRYRLVARRGEP